MLESLCLQDALLVLIKKKVSKDFIFSSLASPPAGQFGLSLNSFFMLAYCDIVWYLRSKLYRLFI